MNYHESNWLKEYKYIHVGLRYYIIQVTPHTYIYIL